MKRRVVDYHVPPQERSRARLSGAMALLRRMLALRIAFGSLVVASVLLTACLGLFFVSRWVAPPAAQATAMLEILPAPSITPSLNAAQLTAAPTGTVLPVPPAGEIAPGAYVQVTGTGGTGLRLRDVAGLGGQVLIVAGEAEVFQVQDGPTELDGYTWWYLVGPFDEQRRGWGVVNYLQVVQGP